LLKDSCNRHAVGELCDSKARLSSGPRLRSVTTRSRSRRDARYPHESSGRSTRHVLRSAQVACVACPASARIPALSGDSIETPASTRESGSRIFRELFLAGEGRHGVLRRWRALEQGDQAAVECRRDLSDPQSVIHLVGAILLEQDDEWLRFLILFCCSLSDSSGRSVPRGVATRANRSIAVIEGGPSPGSRRRARGLDVPSPRAWS
jgi:hypothetical protein